MVDMDYVYVDFVIHRYKALESIRMFVDTGSTHIVLSTASSRSSISTKYPTKSRRL